MSDEIPAPGGAKPVGLLLSRDLIFTSKVTGTASALGHQVAVAGQVAQAMAMIEESGPQVVFVDLAAGELVASPALLRYRGVAAAGTPFLAFGSHVDVDALAEAARAGCDPVMPRSRFTNELPALIRRYLGEG